MRNHRPTTRFVMRSRQMNLRRTPPVLFATLVIGACSLLVACGGNRDSAASSAPPAQSAATPIHIAPEDEAPAPIPPEVSTEDEPTSTSQTRWPSARVRRGQTVIAGTGIHCQQTPRIRLPGGGTTLQHAHTGWNGGDEEHCRENARN